MREIYEAMVDQPTKDQKTQAAQQTPLWKWDQLDYPYLDSDSNGQVKLSSEFH